MTTPKPASPVRFRSVVRPRVSWHRKTGIIIGSEHPHHRRAYCLTDNGRTEYVQWHELRALDSTPWPNAKAKRLAHHKL